MAITIGSRTRRKDQPGGMAILAMVFHGLEARATLHELNCARCMSSCIIRVSIPFTQDQDTK